MKLQMLILGFVTKIKKLDTLDIKYKKVSQKDTQQQ